MHNSRKILILNCDAECFLICLLVYEGQVEAKEAPDGDRLLIAIAEFMPDLIFMDRKIPRVCGVDVPCLIRSEVQLQHIPVIYFSAADEFPQSDLEEEENVFGANPLEVDELLALTSRLFLKCRLN